MSTRQTPAGVQFIGAVGGFAGGLVALGATLLVVQSIRAGRLDVAVQVVPVLVLSVADVTALYGLVRLRRWGYVWTRRLFGLTLLVNAPAAVGGGPVPVGTVVFSAVVLVYLWLAETSTFRRGVGGAADAGSETDDPVDVALDGPEDRPPSGADPLGDSPGVDTDTDADEGTTDHGNGETGDGPTRIDVDTPDDHDGDAGDAGGESGGDGDTGADADAGGESDGGDGDER